MALVALVIAIALASAGCSRRVTPEEHPGQRPSKKAAKPAKMPATQKPYRVMGRLYRPIADASGFRQRGLASWYGKDFHGRKTSNGETYNMYAVSAAHKTLPMNTWVRVTHQDSGATLDVRINDRGPFVRGRIIDLSYAAAKKLNIVGPGTAKVEIEALGIAEGGDGTTPRTYRKVTFDRGNFTFQVGAFTVRANAERLKQELDKTYQNAHITRYDTGREVFYRVRVGRSHSLDQAMDYEDYLIQNGFPDAFTVAED